MVVTRLKLSGMMARPGSVVSQLLDGADALGHRDSGDRGEFAVLALGAFAFHAKLHRAEVSARIVRESHGLSVRAALFFGNNGVVVFHLFALNVLRSTGDFTAFEYQNGGHLQGPPSC